MDIAKALKDERVSLIKELEKLSAERNVEKLEKITRNMLREDLNDFAGLYFMARAFAYSNKEELAATLLQKVIAGKPNNAEIWELLGSVYEGMYMYERAIECYEQSLDLDPNNSVALGSIASSYVGISKPEIAIEYAQKGLESNPDSIICKANLGIANMMLGNWSEGWQGYEQLLGHPGTKRKIIHYGGMQKWDGSDVDCVVTYAEQGIGDSIMFSSCIEDAQKHAKKIVIDCDKKLEGLFKRSFPDCDVYGTRHDMNPGWPGKYQVDASIAMGSLPSLFRTSKESFQKKPYLVADKNRRTMYRALLDSWGSKPKIGISWTGGNLYGGFRKLELDKLERIINSVDADFVSLQYKNTPTFDLPIRVLPFATETNDYDDTAALVAELDLVISVPQACVHLAGALGKDCWCIVPDATRWIYGVEGKEHSWYESVELFRDWDKSTDEIINRLKLRYDNRT